MLERLKMVRMHNTIVIANVVELVAESLLHVNLKEVEEKGVLPLTKAEAKSIAFRAVNKRIKGGVRYVG